MKTPAKICGRGTRPYALLVLVIMLFGTAWPTIKLGLQGGATPMWFAAGRAILSTAISFLALLAFGGLRRPAREDLPVIASIGLLQFAAFFALSSIGLAFVRAGPSAVLAYSMSLWLVPLAALTGEHVPRCRLVGTGLGLGGVAILMSPFTFDWTSMDVLIGHLCLLLAALAWAIAIFHTRQYGWRHLTPIEALPWQMLLASSVLSTVAFVAEPGGQIAPTKQSFISLAYVGLVAAPLANWAATEVSRALPTVVSSIGFLGAPVLGVTLSVFWLGEPLTLALMAGGSLVLVGLGLVVIPRREPKQEP